MVDLQEEAIWKCIAAQLRRYSDMKKVCCITILCLILAGCCYPVGQQPEIEIEAEKSQIEYEPMLYPFAYGSEAFSYILKKYTEEGWTIAQMVAAGEGGLFIIWIREVKK